MDLPVRHAAPLLRVALAEQAGPRRPAASRPTGRTPTSARSTTSSTRSWSPASPGAPSADSSTRSASPCVRSASGSSPACSTCRTAGSAAAQDVHSRAVQGAADHAQDWLAQTVWQSKQFYFHQTWFIVFLLVAVLFANRFIPRFWCRVLCPLGAFLGVFSRFALFGMTKDHAKCTDCNLCLVNCQGADSPQGGVKWRQDECHMCMNCENACPEDVIKFTFLPNRTEHRPRAGHRAPHRARGRGRGRDVPARRRASPTRSTSTTTRRSSVRRAPSRSAGSSSDASAAPSA